MSFCNQTSSISGSIPQVISYLAGPKIEKSPCCLSSQFELIACTMPGENPFVRITAPIYVSLGLNVAGGEHSSISNGLSTGVVSSGYLLDAAVLGISPSRGATNMESVWPILRVHTLSCRKTF